MAAVILIGLLWGVPMYLVDRRARHNGRSNRKRLLIAVLMIWWGLLIPLVIALHLAGPSQAGPTRRRAIPRGSYPPDDEDEQAVREEEDTRMHEELDDLHHGWGQHDSWEDE